MFRHTLVILLLQNQEWALKNQWNSWDCEAVLTPITAAGSVPENRNHWITRRPVYWLCFQETSTLALFSGDQYIGSVFGRPVYWLCFQETSILALFSGHIKTFDKFAVVRLQL